MPGNCLTTAPRHIVKKLYAASKIPGLVVGISAQVFSLLSATCEHGH
jgi:hypothetical protein